MYMETFYGYDTWKLDCGLTDEDNLNYALDYTVFISHEDGTETTASYLSDICEEEYELLMDMTDEQRLEWVVSDTGLGTDGDVLRLGEFKPHSYLR